jgi:hypothetical protein
MHEKVVIYDLKLKVKIFEMILSDSWGREKVPCKLLFVPSKIESEPEETSRAN